LHLPLNTGGQLVDRAPRTHRLYSRLRCQKSHNLRGWRHDSGFLRSVGRSCASTHIHRPSSRLRCQKRHSLRGLRHDSGFLRSVGRSCASHAQGLRPWRTRKVVGSSPTETIFGFFAALPFAFADMQGFLFWTRRFFWSRIFRHVIRFCFLSSPDPMFFCLPSTQVTCGSHGPTYSTHISIVVRTTLSSRRLLRIQNPAHRH